MSENQMKRVTRTVAIVAFLHVISFIQTAQACRPNLDIESDLNVDGELWSRLVRNSATNEPDVHLIDNAGNIWFSGRNCVPGYGAGVAIYDANGLALNSVGFENYSSARVDRLLLAKDGSVFAAGFRNSEYEEENGQRGVFLYKLDENGSSLRQGFHVSRTYDGAEAVFETASGEIVVISNVGTRNAGQDVEIIRFDRELNVLEALRSFSPGDDIAYHAAITQNENIWVVGKKWTGKPETGIKAWIALYTPSGKLLRERFIGDNGHPSALDVVISTSDGGAWAAGHIGGKKNAVLIRVNSKGKIVRKVELELDIPPNGDNPLAFVKINPLALAYGLQRITDMAETADGGILAVGYTVHPKTGQFDVLVVRVDPSGKLMQSKSFGTLGGDIASSIFPVGDGSYLVAGATTNGEHKASITDWYGWLFKVGPNGEIPDFVNLQNSVLP